MPTVTECPENPILTVHDAAPYADGGFFVIGAFNPGVAVFRGRTVLLVRVAERPDAVPGKVIVPTAEGGAIRRTELDEDDPAYDFSDARVVTRRGGKRLLTSLSRFLVAVSEDGVRFTFTGAGVFPEGEYETFGIEDPRVTRIDGAYYITYSAVSDKGVAVGLMRTADFWTFTRLGIILPPENKDAAIFPEKIGGRYYMLHRPSSSDFSRPEIWIAESPDLLCWGGHRRVAGVGSGWDSARIGSSSVPVRIPEGWLVLYHGADGNDRYCLGALLLDAERPWIVRKRSVRPLLEPVRAYEREGFFGGVVFACGMTVTGENVRIYYGAADDKICLADTTVREILAGMRG